MIVGNSKLFLSYARPVLQDLAADNPDETSATMAEAPGIMDSIIQYLINRSRLDVSLVKITNATEECVDPVKRNKRRRSFLTDNSSFVVTIESRVTGTGPINSTISAMELDLTFNGFSFGKIHLPSIHTSLWGTKVNIYDQTIKITDMAIYKAFIRSILTDNETCFQLENGTCTIKALGVTAHCNYCLEIPILGMLGPKTVIKKIDKDGDGHVRAVIDVQNPGPVEIYHGWSLFELKNDKQETVADLEGNFELKRGWSELALAGKLRDGAAFSATAKSRLVAKGVEANTWCNETIQFIDTSVELKRHHLENLQG